MLTYNRNNVTLFYRGRRSMEKLEAGTVYRLKRNYPFVGGYNYPLAYDKGLFIHLRVLSGPDAQGFYDVTTKGEDGRHLGPGGGWGGESKLTIRPSSAEEIPLKENG